MLEYSETKVEQVVVNWWPPILDQLTVFLQRQSHKKYATHVAGYHRVHASPGHSCETSDAFPIMNPLARTRLYTSIAAGESGVRDRTDRAVGVASVMLQVQCISLPKRFVPSVSKCPSVVCLRTRLSLSLFLSFSFPPNLHDLRPSISPGRYRFARANAFSREKEGETQPPLAHSVRGQRSHVN